jgi:hypothetical protein
MLSMLLWGLRRFLLFLFLLLLLLLLLLLMLLSSLCGGCEEVVSVRGWVPTGRKGFYRAAALLLLLGQSLRNIQKV